MLKPRKINVRPVLATLARVAIAGGVVGIIGSGIVGIADEIALTMSQLEK